MLASYILYDDLPLWILLLLYVAILIFYYLGFRYSICLLSLQCTEGECFLPKEIDKMFVRSTNISQPRTFTTYWWALFRKIQSTAADDFFLPLLSGSRKNLPKNFSICIKMTGIINHHRDQITLGKSSVISHVCWFRHRFSWKLLQYSTLFVCAEYLLSWDFG